MTHRQRVGHGSGELFSGDLRASKNFTGLLDLLTIREESDIVGARHLAPCRMGTYRHSLPPEWFEAKEPIDFGVRGILTMIRRVELVANASAAKWGDKEPITTNV